jgi:hypothetical protein
MADADKQAGGIAMEHFFDQQLPMAGRRKYVIQRTVLAAFAIAIGWLATARADIGALPRAGGSGDAAATPAAQSAQSNSHANAGASEEIGDVTVKAPTPPTDQELAGNSLADFVLHHATTHYVNVTTAPNLARWRGGRQSICPLTEGLSPGYSAFVTARVRALAAYVGAPVESDPQCKPTVQILFTSKPQEKMDAVMNWATGPAFRNRYAGGGRNLIAFKSDNAIQGWYLTTGSGSAVLNTDVSLVGFSVEPVWPQIEQKYIGSTAIGTRVAGGSGSGIGIGIVILVVDTTKVVGDTIGTIADYLAMLTLSVAQSPDHCDPLPSILDLMSSSCGTRARPTGITAGDLAFLKALYYKNTGLGASPSRSSVEDNMAGQFKFVSNQAAR